MTVDLSATVLPSQVKRTVKCMSVPPQAPVLGRRASSAFLTDSTGGVSSRRTPIFSLC